MNRFVIVIFIFFAQNTFAQSSEHCDSFFKKPDVLAIYGVGKKSLFEYFDKKIKPIIQSCICEDSTLISKIKLIFTIDNKGKLVAVKLPNLNNWETCKSDLRTKFLQMHLWTPAFQNDFAVCSELDLSLTCILWK